MINTILKVFKNLFKKVIDNDVEIANQKDESESLINKNIIENLINTSRNTEVANFIANNYLYEKGPRGFEIRKIWFDNLDINTRSSLGLYKIKFYNEILDIIDLKFKLSLMTINNLESLKYLTKLTSLKLEFDEINKYGDRYYDCTNIYSAIDLTPIAYLSNLEELELFSYTFENVSPLRYLYKLKKLSIINLNPRDFSEMRYEESQSLHFNFLHENTRLENLKIINFDLKTIPPILESNKIKILNLAKNSIYDISILSKFNDIEELNLASNKKIKDFSSLNNLNKLTCLNLNNTEIEDLPIIYYESSNDYNFISLKKLYLRKTNIKNIDSICKLDSLEILDLSENDIEDLSPLKNLTNLSELILDSIQAIDVECLCNINQLKKLSLLNCKLTNDEQKSLTSSLPDCDIVFNILISVRPY